MQLTSPEFNFGEAIPARFTCEGENISPELAWTKQPKETRSFALVLHDPDAPRPGGFTHWVAYNIPANKGGLRRDVPKEERISGIAMQGKNDGGKLGYTGPCPPKGTHRYYFKLFALDQDLSLGPGLTHHELTEAIKGHILGEAELMGTYQKQAKKAA